MNRIVSILKFTILIILISEVVASCYLLPTYHLSETDSGTIIMNATKQQGDTVTFQVTSPTSANKPHEFLVDIQNSFRLTNYNTTFTLANTKPLDLEQFSIDYGVDITPITLSIDCGGGGTNVYIIVTPVNEFSPVFKTSPYNITLPESTTVGTVVYKLRDKVEDYDVGGSKNFYFAIHPYAFPDHDGSSFFNIPAISAGNITLIKTLDYDIEAGSIRYLNLSVADGPSTASRTTYTLMEIHIEDVDDQAPYFEYPNCSKPCPASAFVAVIHLNDTGLLTITPPLKGIDEDTLGTALLYSIKSGNEKKLFDINKKSGTVTQLTSVNSSKISEAEFRLVIEVRKDLPKVGLSSIAILTVKVWERMPNDTGCSMPPVGKSAEDTGGSSLLIPLIVLGIVLVIVFVVLIVVSVLYQKKRREMAVRTMYETPMPHTEAVQYDLASYT